MNALTNTMMNATTDAHTTPNATTNGMVCGFGSSLAGPNLEWNKPKACHWTLCTAGSFASGRRKISGENDGSSWCPRSLSIKLSKKKM